jgi:hypothetical protein
LIYISITCLNQTWLKIQIVICIVNRWTFSINLVFCCKGRGKTYFKDLSGEQTWIVNNLDWFVSRQIFKIFFSSYTIRFSNDILFTSDSDKYIYTYKYIYFFFSSTFSANLHLLTNQSKLLPIHVCSPDKSLK